MSTFTEQLAGASDPREAASEERFACLERAQAIVDKGERENRDLTDAEKREFDGLIRRARVADTAKDMTWDGQSGTPPVQLWDTDHGHQYRPKQPRSKWVDSEGRPVHVLARDQRLVDMPLSNGEKCPTDLSLGNFIVASVTGKWDRFPKEKKFYNAMASNINTAGGFLVPEELSRRVIDYARNSAAVLKAGAQFVPMSTDRMTIARLTADPTMEYKGENDSFTSRDLSFDAVGLTSYTLGCLITMSRELAADAPNIGQVVEQTLGNALAVEIDRFTLIGTGNQEPTGLLNIANVGTTAAVGAIAWTDVLTAAVDVMANNGTPNAYIAHPTIIGDLAALTSGDGTNSAALWQGPPEIVRDLERYSSANVSTANLFCGDFERVLIGLRQDPLIEVSTEAGDAFAKHQILCKITWRGDANIEQPTHMHFLAGVTT